MAEKVDHDYQPNARLGHTANIVGDYLYVWSGRQIGLPHTHDDKEKRKFTSKVEILNLANGKWKHSLTTGNPPLGVIGCASTIIDGNIIYFGGDCFHDDDDGVECYHNSVTSLCVKTLNWKELSPTNLHTGPSMKNGQMISVKIDGKDYLLVIGGCGPSVNIPKQRNAEYQYSRRKMPSGYVRTNEYYYYDLSNGQWILPTVSGDCPPPCDSFSLTSLTTNTFIMFGGTTPEGNTNSLYVGHCDKSKSLDWQKLTDKSKVNWPSSRISHATAAIDEDHIIMIGGFPINDCSDCWIFNVNTKLWKKFTLPQSVTGRWSHSLSSYNVTSDIVWVIEFGGNTLPDKSSLIKRMFRDDPSLISDTSVIELIRTDDGEWCVGEVMTYPLNYYELKLRKRRQSYQPSIPYPITNTSQLQPEIQQLRQKLQESKGQLQKEHQEKQKLLQEIDQLKLKFQESKGQLQKEHQEKQQLLQEIDQLKLKFQESKGQLQKEHQEKQKLLQETDQLKLKFQELKGQLQKEHQEKQKLLQETDQLKLKFQELKGQLQKEHQEKQHKIELINKEYQEDSKHQRQSKSQLLEKDRKSKSQLNKDTSIG